MPKHIYVREVVADPGLLAKCAPEMTLVEAVNLFAIDFTEEAGRIYRQRREAMELETLARLGIALSSGPDYSRISRAVNDTLYYELCRAVLPHYGWSEGDIRCIHAFYRQRRQVLFDGRDIGVFPPFVPLVGNEPAPEGVSCHPNPPAVAVKWPSDTYSNHYICFLNEAEQTVNVTPAFARVFAHWLKNGYAEGCAGYLFAADIDQRLLAADLTGWFGERAEFIADTDGDRFIGAYFSFPEGLPGRQRLVAGIELALAHCMAQIGFCAAVDHDDGVYLRKNDSDADGEEADGVGTSFWVALARQAAGHCFGCGVTEGEAVAALQRAWCDHGSEWPIEMQDIIVRKTSPGEGFVISGELSGPSSN